MFSSFLPVGILGLFAGVLGNVTLAAAHGDAGSIGVIATGGGAGVVVSVMGWIVKKVIAGEVVPVPIAQLIEHMEKRDEKIDKLLNDMLSERAENRMMIRSSTEANFAIYEHLRSVGGATASAGGRRPGSAPTGIPGGRDEA